MSFWFVLWIGSIIGCVMIAQEKKLSAVGYFFIGLFLGPVGCLIAVLSPDAKHSSHNYSNNTALNTRDEIQQLKDQLSNIQKRLEWLELNSKEERPTAVAPEIKIEHPIVSEKKPDIALNVTSTVDQPFEVVFGRLWLNRIGVVLFVLGIGLLISYSFQYFTPILKITLGYLLALSLILWGSLLEKKSGWTKWSWGILAGGWGLVYLCTYAMHYIPATRIIESTSMSVAALALVNAITIVYNLKYKSAEVTTMTYVLGFITLGLGGYDVSTTILWSLIVLSMSILGCTFEWPNFLMLGMVGSYVIFIVWLFPFDFNNFDRLWMLLINWTIFAASLLILWRKKGDVQSTVTGNIANTSLFMVSIAMIVPHTAYYYSNWILLAAMAHMILAGIYRWAQGPRLIVAHISLAIVLLTLYIWLKNPFLIITVLWMSITVMLTVIGFYYKEIIYRNMAVVLSCLIVVHIFWSDIILTQRYHLMINSCVGLIFLSLGILYHIDQFKKHLTDAEAQSYPYLFTWMGAGLIFFLIQQQCADHWLTIAWMMEGVTALIAGFILKHRPLRLAALTILLIDLFRVIVFELSGFQTLYKIAAVTILGIIFVGASFLYARYNQERNPKSGASHE